MEGKARNEAEEEEEEESDFRWRKDEVGDENVASVGFMAKSFCFFFLFLGIVIFNAEQHKEEGDKERGWEDF